MHHHTIHTLLSEFQPISLAEMDAVELMDRVDSKYVFTISQLIDVLHDCLHEYQILEINTIRNHLYDSLYFDTADFLMYYLHHYQRLNRHKVRFRKYTSSNGLTFFEIKYKNNKEKTYKKRKKYQDIEPFINPELNDFLSEHTSFSATELIPVLKVQYYRMTLVHQNMNERVTIDTYLHYDNFTNAYQFENLVIAEVKRNSYAEQTTFMKVLKKHHIREGGLSKYCTGLACTTAHLKKNNFLPKIRYFEKINALC